MVSASPGMSWWAAHQVDQWMTDADGKLVTVKAEGTYYAGTVSSFIISDAPPADAKALGSARTIALPTSRRQHADHDVRRSRDDVGLHTRPLVLELQELN